MTTTQPHRRARTPTHRDAPTPTPHTGPQPDPQLDAQPVAQPQPVAMPVAQPVAQPEDGRGEGGEGGSEEGGEGGGSAGHRAQLALSELQRAQPRVARHTSAAEHAVSNETHGLCSPSTYDSRPDAIESAEPVLVDTTARVEEASKGRGAVRSRRGGGGDGGVAEAARAEVGSGLSPNLAGGGGPWGLPRRSGAHGLFSLPLRPLRAHQLLLFPIPWWRAAGPVIYFKSV